MELLVLIIDETIRKILSRSQPGGCFHEGKIFDSPEAIKRLGIFAMD